MTSTNWKTVAVHDTGYPADSIEWCLFEPYLNYFVCGTYLLLEDEAIPEERNVQERVGNIQLFSYQQQKLTTVQTIDTDGILDIKWCPTQCASKIFLGCSTAKGDVCVFQFLNRKLAFVSKINLRTNEDGDYMVLALNWLKHGTKVCVTDNKGNVAVILFDANNLSLETKWKAHDLEAWTVAYSPYDINLIYSGGDDAKLKIWDLRSGLPVQKATCNRHETGVTIIQPETGEENLILVGSFDENLNFWDPRNLKVPQNSVKCSGGLWRIKCLRNYVLTGNIYGGYQIIELSQNPTVLSNYKEHSSLAYGADWSLLNNFENNCSSFIIGTCSFYDRKLTVSTWDPKQLL